MSGLVKLLSVLLLVVILSGCMNQPAGTVPTTVDDKPALAYDLDGDGIPDVADDGRILIVPGSEIYKYTETADSWAPTVLETVGGLIGVPLLVGIGAAWRKHKFGRIFGNTVMTFQTARQRLKTAGFDKALDIVDETLGTQTLETTKAIRDIKEKLRAVPVG